jgi:alpha-tubulin suppressor-like RCC1 family protein
VALVVAGCYDPPHDACAIRCTGSAADACPSGLVCNTQGYCVGSAADVCTTALTTVRVGAFGACGLDGDGRLYCWGDDTGGAVGLGAGSDGVIAPTTVGAPSDHWTAVATGGDHTCAIKDGEVYCWGENGNGEVRGNPGGTQPTPFKVPTSPSTALPASGFSQISAGGEHSCAIGDGQLWCWGAKEAIGQDVSFMERVGTLADWSEVSAGKSHTCGISTSMGLLCFGRNDRGQLGQTDQQDRATPTAPANGLPAGVPLHVAAGAGFTCAIMGTAATDTMGTLWCWGENGSKEVDDNNGMNPIVNAEHIGTAADWTQITAGLRRVCGLHGGHAYCWGSNFFGGLGNGVWNISGGSINAADLGEADDIELGNSTNNGSYDELGCLSTGGHTKCWGQNNHGDLGAGIAANQTPRPVEVQSPNDHAWTHIVIGHRHSCGITDDRSVFCWGENADGEVTGVRGRGTQSAPCIPDEPCDQPLPILAAVPSADQVTDGWYYTCVRDGSAITCFGNDDHNQLGADGDIVRPVNAPGGEHWTTLLGGDRGNCGITDANKLYCWGWFYNGQALNTPTQLTDANLQPSMLDVKVGNNFTCGVRSDHARICWGQNNNAELGNGTQTDIGTPTPATLLPTIDAVAVRSDHACAIGDTDQHVACWGGANQSELGTTTNPMTTPNPVTDAGGQMLAGCTSVTTADGVSCAVCMGKALCWGGDYDGELGRGMVLGMQDPHAAPVALPQSLTFTEIASGTNHSCAVSMDGRLFCWGFGQHGELGDGSHALPYPVLIAPGR